MPTRAPSYRKGAHIELGVFAPGRHKLSEITAGRMAKDIRAFVEIDGRRVETPVDQQNDDHMTALDHWWAAQRARPGSSLRFDHHYAFIVLLFDAQTSAAVVPPNELPGVRAAIVAARAREISETTPAYIAGGQRLELEAGDVIEGTATEIPAGESTIEEVPPATMERWRGQPPPGNGDGGA